MRGPPARTFIALVEDRPGVLARIASLFRRRNFNIESLAVGRSERPGVSRLTLVARADDDTARRLEASLYGLVDVVDVQEVSHRPTVLRELALVKVRAGAEERARVLQVAEVFRARVVDVSPAAVTLEITGTQEKIDGLVGVLRSAAEIVEMVRTGVVAVTRGRADEEEESWRGSTTRAISS